MTIVDPEHAASVRVPLEQLTELATSLLIAAGHTSEAARTIAVSLVDADARGIASHGVTRLPIYVERLRCGVVDPAAQPVVRKETSSSLQLDACNAPGQLAAAFAVDAGIRKTADAPVCAVGVHGSNHCGALGFFVRQATDAGLVTLALTAAPPTMACFGSRTRTVGTNPLAIGVPRHHDTPYVLDMSCSVVARGKIIMAAANGQAIPEGWAIDPDGAPTTNAEAALAGSVLAFAGPKGSGLALMIELLAGALTGAATGEGIGDLYHELSTPQNVGHLFIFLDPEAFAGAEAFDATVREVAARTHSSPTAVGFDEVLMPGEVEDRRFDASARDGVPVDRNDIRKVVELARGVGAHSGAVDPVAEVLDGH